MLTDSAFNALLKTLEEPPRHAVFILATTEPHKLPATILSRCMRFDFHLVSTEKLTDLLVGVFEKEGIKIEREAAREIAVKAEGGVRDCLSIAECVAAYSDKTITLEKPCRCWVLMTARVCLILQTQSTKKILAKHFRLSTTFAKTEKHFCILQRPLFALSRLVGCKNL